MDVIANKVGIFSTSRNIFFCLGFVKHPKYQCPITSAEFNGSKQFFGIWVCGHTVSEPVLRELKGKTDTHKCPGTFLKFYTGPRALGSKPAIEWSFSV